MKYIYAAIFMIFITGTLSAQLMEGTIQLSGVGVTADKEYVSLKFSTRIPQNAVKRNHVFVFVPSITDGEYNASFSAVVVEGKGAKTAHIRHEWAAEVEYPAVPIYTSNGELIEYSATVPIQPWMDGSYIKVEAITAGCCSSKEYPDVSLPGNLDISWLRPVPEPDPVIEEPVFMPVSVADTLSLTLPFVAEASALDVSDPFKIYDGDRENSVVIYFEQGRSNIDVSLGDNQLMLAELISAIRRIDEDNSSEVFKVIVGGFASPEGSTAFNESLAKNRAEAVKDFIVRGTDIPDDDILMHNGSVDWNGLKLIMQESDFPERGEVIRIIDEIPVWDARNNTGRHSELMRLNGGETYRMLYDEYFPQLRRSACVMVFYKNTVINN